MFTGIVEGQAILLEVESVGTNKRFLFSSDLAGELHLDQSLAHDGVCLTVDALPGEGQYGVTAVLETLNRTHLNHLIPGDKVNLERCMPATGRFDGHLVQGHVDACGTVRQVDSLDGSFKLWVEYGPEAGLTVPKGSICVNGVSLTVVDSAPGAFSVVIVPYTWEHTGFQRVKIGDVVNLEFDILGKYIQAWLARTQQ